MIGEISLESDVASAPVAAFAAKAAEDLFSHIAGKGCVRVAEQAFDERPVVVFVLGGPGAGKGTQCDLIVQKYGYQHISAGDCLRAERASGSADADLINTFIKEGKIVPVEITVKLLLKAMKDSGKSKFLIDGFPRNLDNLEGWIKVVGVSARVELVLYFDCPQAVMQTRLLTRGETSGRTDDNLESIIKRFGTFYAESLPIIHKFESQGKVRHISADRPKEEVWADVQRIVDQLEIATAPTYYKATVTVDLPAAGGAQKFFEESARLQVASFGQFGSAVRFNTSVKAFKELACCSGTSSAACCSSATTLMKQPSTLGVLFVGLLVGAGVAYLAKK